MGERLRTGPILIVDDDEDIRESLRDLLTDEGYATAEATNGVEALAYLRSHGATCPLVLLDWNMPVMDASGLVEALDAEPAVPQPPTIVLTADSRMLERATHRSFVAAMPKPVDLAKLFALIHRYGG